MYSPIWAITRIAPTASRHLHGETVLVKAGRFIRRDQVIFTLLLVVALINFIISPLFSVVLPVYAKAVFGSPIDLGLMFAGAGGGSLAATLLFGAVGHRLPRRAILLGGLLGTAIPLSVLALTPGLAVTLAATAAVGVVSGPINPVLMTVYQERVPAEMRGRVFGLLRAIAWGAMPLGMLVAGYLLGGAGLRFTLGVQAAAFTAVALSLAVSPVLRDLGPSSNAVTPLPDADGKAGSL